MPLLAISRRMEWYAAGRRCLWCAVLPITILLWAILPIACVPAEPEPANPAEQSRVGSVAPVSLDMLKTKLASTRGRPLLVNVWATWCPPCVEEMPALAAFYRAYEPRGVQFLSLSADLPDDLDTTVGLFVEEHKIPFPVLVMDGIPPDDLAATLQVGDTGWDGPLPATFLFDAKGELKEVWFEALTLAELERAVKPLLDATPA